MSSFFSNIETIKKIFSKQDVIPEFEQQKYKGQIFVGKVLFTNEENYTCDIFVQNYKHRFDGVSINSSYCGPRGFIGALPEFGSNVLLTWPLGDETYPYIISYYTADENDKRFQLNRFIHPDSTNNVKDDFDLYLGDYRIDRSKRSRKLYEGDILAESSKGAYLYLSDDLTLSNQRLNEIEIRSADQSIRLLSLNQNSYAAGIRETRGLVIRNNEFGWLKSLGFEQTKYETEIVKLRENHAAALPDGSFHYIVTENKADATNLTKDRPHTLDFLQTKGKVITDLPDTNGAPEFWGSDLRIQPSSSIEVKSFAYTEDRCELIEIHDGILDVNDDFFGFDADFPLTSEINPEQFFRKERSKNLFFIRNVGTLIGNDPNSENYGRVLIPNLFSHPYATKPQTVPLISAKDYAEFSFQEFEKQISTVERRQGSALHFSFPLNANVGTKITSLAVGGIKPPTESLNAQGVNDALQIGLDSFIWGFQLDTTEAKYNEDPDNADQPFPASYTRFDFLKSGNLVFNIAASDETYGQLRGTGSNENFAVTGFGPNSGAGVSFTETNESNSEKLAGWSIEGNIEGATKLIMGRDLARRISLAFQTYGMLYGTIGNDLPAQTTTKNPNELGSNNSYNIKIEGKGRLFHGKNFKDGLSLESRFDGRVFYHIGSATGDVTAVEATKSGNVLAENRDGKEIKESPNGALTDHFFNRKGGLITRTGNTSLELATDGSIHIPYIGKETNSERSLTIYADGSIEIGHELEPIGANKNNPNANNVDPTFNQSLRTFTEKAIQIRIGSPSSNANSPIAKGREQSGGNVKTYDKEEPLNADIPGGKVKSPGQKVQNAIKNQGVAFNLEVYGNVFTTIKGNEYHYVEGDRFEYVAGSKVEVVKKDRYTLVDGSGSKSNVAEYKNYDLKISKNWKASVSKDIEFKANKIELTAGTGLTSKLSAKSNNISVATSLSKVEVNGIQVNLG